MTHLAPLGPGEFAGTARYTPTRVLGAGSWGRVYQAYDNERNAFVALKVLSAFGPEALLRFKREFRALQSVVHPNLVGLYELISTTDRWFFTMEYVDGATFIDYVNGGPPPAGQLDAASSEGHTSTRDARGRQPQDGGAPAPAPSQPTTQPGRGPAAAWSAGPAPLRPPLPPEALERLRGALGQLVDGLCALHAAGKLHRDIKPSNVLVSRKGKVVVLDFGLVRELDATGVELTQGLVVGTPAYMSPEQSAGLPVKESTDWYSVGALLYKTLTGRVPFEQKPGGSPRQAELLPPSAVAEGVPEDLERLCVELLARDPDQRPTGEKLRALLVRAPRAALPPSPQPEDAPELIGRDGLREQLAGAFAQVGAGGKGALTLVEGETGSGKSALIHAFAQAVRREHRGAVVLSGRCGEAEAVPFKAFDAVIDALCVYLASQPVAVIEAVLPRDFAALVRLFPVLGRLEALTGKRAAASPADSQELRRKAFRALAQLLSRLAERAPLLLVIDDLQWGDTDSAALLEAVLEPSEAPALHLVAAARTPAPNEKPTPLVAALLRAARAGAESGRLVEQRLTCFPLEPAAAQALIRRLMPGAAEADVAALSRESHGSPYLIHALTAVARAGGDVTGVTVDAWMRARVGELPAPARALVECLAVANRPVPRLVAWHAAGLDRELSDPLAQLKAARLVSGSGAGANEALQLYDAAVGKAVRAQLSPERQAGLYRLLAESLLSVGSNDVDTLAEWWEGAGEVERAWRTAVQAAEHAAAVLAFNRAIALYERALRSAPEPERPALARARADALADAGRGKDAADAYLELAGAERETRASLSLRQLAADQLLTSGRLDDGIFVLEGVLAELGETPARGKTGALMGVAWSRLRATVRGLGYQLRSPETIDPDALARVDAYWSATRGFSLVDQLRSANYQFIHLRLALDCGEPTRVARALALEAGYHATIGVSHQAQSREALAGLRQVLDSHPQPHGEGLEALMKGCAALGTGYFAEARAPFQLAVSTFEERCPGKTWELITSQQYLALVLTQLGELSEARRLVTEVLASAQARHDVYALTNFRVRAVPTLELIDDAPERVEPGLLAALGEFARTGYFIQHYWGLNGKVLAELYRGDGARARAHLEREAAQVKAAGMLRLQITRVLWAWLQGTTALAAGLPDEARRAMKALAAENLPWSLGLATVLEAMLALAAGDPARASTLLSTGADRLETMGVHLHAAAARRRRAELLPAAERAAAVAEADAWFSTRGVKNPERFVNSLLPRPAPR